MNIVDVAREAGVSTATVSRVLNSLPVREENRRKVEAAIKKMEYIPNMVARGLTSRQSFAIGLIVTSVSNSYYLEITESIERKLRERGLMLFLCSADSDRAEERRYLTDLVSRRVDGIIAVDPSLEVFESGFLGGIAKRVPLVLVHSHPSIGGIDSIFVDQAAGMNAVMENLWGLGHRDIAFLRGAEGYTYDLKEEAYRAFLAGRGRKPREERVIEIPQGNAIEAIEQAEERMSASFAEWRRAEGGDRPTALFACNDLMALGSLKAAEHSGIRVPEELSIFGHDNTALAMCGTKTLSSVDLHPRSLGSAAADLLIHAMYDEDKTPRRVLVEPGLVIRESTTAPVSSHG